MDEKNEVTKEERPDGGQTGAQFVKKIGVVGCVFFLAVSILVTVFCLFSKPVADAPAGNGTEQAESGETGDGNG